MLVKNKRQNNEQKVRNDGRQVRQKEWGAFWPDSQRLQFFWPLQMNIDSKIGSTVTVQALIDSFNKRNDCEN